MKNKIKYYLWRLFHPRKNYISKDGKRIVILTNQESLTITLTTLRNDKSRKTTTIDGTDHPIVVSS